VSRPVSRTPDADPRPTTARGEGTSDCGQHEEQSAETDPLKVLTPDEFAEVVEVFRILKRWRDEARR
jgi:hypothetical protein